MTLTPQFLFATGIENSSPTIDNGRTRMDEFEKCGHYDRWREDFDLVTDLGVRFLRYGVPLYKVYTAADKYDWEFSDQTFNDLKKREIAPIADLCHFGVPDWIGNFQNDDFPPLFAKYARAHDLAFIDVAHLLPFDPDLFVDAIHNSYAGERLRAWVFLQGLVPVVERHLKSGAWPKNVEAAKTPAPPFKPRPITFTCKS